MYTQFFSKHLKFLILSNFQKESTKEKFNLIQFVFEITYIQNFLKTSCQILNFYRISQKIDKRDI